MHESRVQTVAMYFGMAAVIFPSMLASGFMPDWNVLPFAAWLGIATGGSALAGAFMTPFWFRGMLSCSLAGLGGFFGTWLYVAGRVWLFNSTSFFQIELIIGMLIGAAPGLILYGTWARDDSHDPPNSPIRGQ